MTTLDPEHVAQTIEYYRRWADVLKGKVDALAVKMGVDPDRDLVIVPEKICGDGELPRWMMASTQRELKLIKGARRAQLRSKNGRRN